MNITLKTLKFADAEDVFFFIVRHLANQNARSTFHGHGCVYRNPEGLKCAAGCLIADDEYSKEFENKTWKALRDAGEVPIEHADLINSCQTVHDNFDPEEWEKVFLGMAIGLGFNCNKVGCIFDEARAIAELRSTDQE